MQQPWRVCLHKPADTHPKLYITIHFCSRLSSPGVSQEVHYAYGLRMLYDTLCDTSHTIHDFFFHILPIVLYARHLAKIPACPMIMLKPGGPMKTQFQWAPSYTKQRISNPTTAWACPNDRLSIGFRVRVVRESGE